MSELQLKTLTILRKYSSAVEVLDDKCFFECLYATLTAWGMHRMGRVNTKLIELDEIQKSFLRQKNQIQQVQSTNCVNLYDNNVEEVTSRIWEIMDSLKISPARTKLVANSKALHHLLPNLVPPIDREYTLRFFYNSKKANGNDELIFKEIFPFFHKIANAREDLIAQRVLSGKGMDTSATKVIDNAIVGYVLGYLKIPEAKDNQIKPIVEYRIDHPMPKLSESNARTMSITEILLRAVKDLVKNQNRKTFTRNDVKQQTGVNREKWNASYSPIFQGMRDDHPGGAPPVGKKYKGVFHRIERGTFILTEYGRELIMKS